MRSNWTKKQVLSWFGERGIQFNSSALKKWLWRDNRLYFIIRGAGTYIADTDEGMVDVTQTHRNDGSPILVYELEDSIPLAASPLGRVRSNWTKKQVLSWFGERGIQFNSSALKKWLWRDNRLYFIIRGAGIYIADTDEGTVDVTQTHRNDGSPILLYELEDSIPLAASPLRE